LLPRVKENGFIQRSLPDISSGNSYWLDYFIKCWAPIIVFGWGRNTIM